jgi:NAD(P)-dependent dehydrogenase (short-subunit alcohol dehydrogenase family)
MPHPYSYEGKRVVVTGAATGVGAALIELLAELGAAHVTVLDLHRPAGPHQAFLQLNLGEEAAVERALREIRGPVHALFNNAGVADTQPPHVVLAVNFLALRRLSEGLLDRIPQGGAIVNTASTAGGQWAARVAQINELIGIADWSKALAWFEEKRASLGQMPYFFSKELVQVYTMRSSRPTLRRGVRTNSVCPSPIDTPLLVDFRKTISDKMIDWSVSESGGRPVSAREVATVLAFLGSEAASYVNGVNLLVDGGMSAAIATGQADFSKLA